MNVLTKIENGKRVLDANGKSVLDSVVNFSMDGCFFDVLKEYKFTWVKNDERLSVWQLNENFQVHVYQDNNIISNIHLIVNDEMYFYTRKNGIWCLKHPSKEIGSASDMIENIMDKIRNKWSETK
jgi:hypothetical protein